MTISEMDVSGSATDRSEKENPEVTVIISLARVPDKILQDEASVGCNILTPFILDKIAGECFGLFHRAAETGEALEPKDLYTHLTALAEETVLNRELDLLRQDWQTPSIENCVWWMIGACFDVVHYFTEHFSDWENYLVLGVGRSGHSIVFIRQGSGTSEYCAVRRKYVRDVICQDIRNPISVHF